MDAAPWLGLGLFVLLIAGSAAYAGARGYAFWRAFRSFQRKLDAAVAETARLLDALEPRVERVSHTGERLEEARARLEESLAVAAVLYTAFGEVRALTRRLSFFFPQ